MKNPSLFENNGAKFSECGKHRLMLWRIWDNTKDLAMFIGLNPSTANAEKDDPTIRRVKSMAQAWGYGGIYMLNLFTYISTDPGKLNIRDGNHADANHHLFAASNDCKLIVFAWGNFQTHGRDKEVINVFGSRAVALHINKNGSPKHPLYCKADSTPIPFKNFVD